MKNKINYPFLILILSILNSCGGLSDASKVLKNEKIKNTDEFLVKKRDPLVLPPEYDKVPEPNVTDVKNIKENEDLKKILKSTKDINSKNKKSSSVEESILDSLKK
jgi:hypothetical protein